MSLLKKIYLGILLLLLCALACLIGTTTGLHLVLKGAVSWVPGLELSEVNGGWRDLTIKQLRYKMPGVTVGAEELHLALDFSCLRHLQLCVNDITLGDVNIGVKTAELVRRPELEVKEQDQSGGTPSTPYPLILRRLALNNIQVKNVQVKVDNTAIALDEFKTGFTFQNNTLIMTRTRIAGLLVALPKTVPMVVEKATIVEAIKSHIRPSKQKWADMEAMWATMCTHPSLAEMLRKLFAQPLLPPLLPFTLPLNLILLGLEGEDLRLTGNTNLVITHLRIQATTSNQHAELTLLDINSPQGLLNASGNAELSGQWPVSMTVNTTLNIDPLKGEKIKFTISGSLRDELRTELNLTGPINAQLEMKIRLAQAGLPLTLSLDSQVLQWPLTGTPQYQVNGMALRLDGEARDYRLTLKAAFGGKGIPPVDIQLNAKGNTEGFTLSRLRLAALQGNTDLSAVVDWQRAINWRSELSLSGINTVHQWPDWPARLDGKITMHGRMHDGNWQLRMPELDLKGNVRQNELTARGSINSNGNGQWQVPQLLLILGRNQMMVQGELKQQFDMNVTFNAPALNSTLPGLDGKAQGNIKLRGDLHAPQLLADFNAHGLRWGKLTVRRIMLKGNIRSSDMIRGDMQLSMDQLQQGVLSISQLTLVMTGNEKQHQLKLTMQGNPITGQLQLNGIFDRQQQRWQGTISQTRFDTPVGEWWLTRVIMLDYQATVQKLFIDSHCWQNTNAQICTLNNIEAGASGQVSLQLNRFDLEMLKSLLPAETQAIGVFTGRADMSWTTGSGLPQGKISLVSNNGVKVSQTIQGKILPISFETLKLHAVLDKERVYFDWLIKIAGNGQFNGQIQVTDLQNKGNLAGNLNINNLSLAMLKPLMLHSESVDGVVNTALSLGGNVQQPQLYGKLGLENLVVKGDFMPFSMTKSRLALSFAGTSSTLQGLIGTANGQINLTGSADWNHMESWYAHIHAKGSRVSITVPPMVRLVMSPDIVFKATPVLFALNGKVDIPWAYIEIKDLPNSTVGISSDEVFLDNNLQLEEDKKDSISIISNLMVHFGNDVHINAFGLKAKLKGDLKVEQDKQGLELNGQIDIPSGRFYAYGQNLIVNKGQMLFSGPVDQPYLNIEAIRNPDATTDNVTAGVRVTGLADQPKVEVFSAPRKSQQEALSYLLRGQGLAAAGADSNMMTSMLIGMGVAQSGQVVGKIGQAFGVSDLALDTQGVGDSSQVVVSGYIAPGLHVKYGVGIFDSLATLTLRYRLMSKLYLEAVSGLEKALDLLYQFEF